jgi:hypothetical protein
MFVAKRVMKQDGALASKETASLIAMGVVISVSGNSVQLF